VDDKNAESSEDEEDDVNSSDSDDGSPKKRRSKKKKSSPKKKSKDSSPQKNEHVEYEYLVKFKGRSYLHLEWKTGADLESMNKSAKTLYRRYLKKIAAGTDDDLESPDFDPAFVEPQKIVDAKEQEITLELTDKELVEWEKERQKAMAEEEAEREANEMNIEGADDVEGTEAEKSAPQENGDSRGEEKKEDQVVVPDIGGDGSEEVDYTALSMEHLRKVANKDGPYYPVIEGCDNPYRDGYVTEPPKKPRSSYLFFQAIMRSYYSKRNPDANVSELMGIIGDKWRNMTDQEQAPFIQLSQEETEQYEKERLLLEKAQRPNEMWQPLRRCLMVLDRLSKDSFAEIFLEPVDMEEFPDYEEMIDSPMDLGTIRQKLADKKYMAPENFARDVRKVWNNCKIYNQHGSAIWHVADYMSKQFERLYHAWVLEFRERYLRWANPRARPWEHTCRQCDGKCGTPDDKMVLCDHCDAMYGFACLKPPLTKMPDGMWHCPDCAPKLHTVKGVRMYSAVAEQAARRRAELGDVPKKQTKEMMYLVKWAGLGYEFCTWETKEDINDDALIEEYYRLNDMASLEPDLTKEEVHEFLDNVKHTSVANAGGVANMPELRSQLYAQTRALHFTKFGEDIPDLLCGGCGPKTKALVTANGGQGRLKEVAECVEDMAWHAARQEEMRLNANLPPTLTGEYDAIIPITAKGLMMNVGEVQGSVSFLGYRSFPDGTKGPAELRHLIRGVGDKIIAVDGHSTVNKSFKEVIMLLKESGKNKFAYMRFLESRYSVCDPELTSVGIRGRYATEEMNKKFSSDRQKLLVQRKEDVLLEEANAAEAEESDESVEGDEDGSGSESDGSEGSFEPDSEDEKILRRETGYSAKEQETPMVESPEKAESEPLTNPSKTCSVSADVPNGGQVAEQKPTDEVPSTAANDAASPKAKQKTEVPLVVKQETTRSLAYRLLDIDIGYSSDEGGDDERAYFLDGVDSTFTALHEVEAEKQVGGNRKTKNSKEKEEGNKDADELFPAKKTQYSTLGNRGKLHASISLTDQKPDPEDFENFPLPSQKQIDAEKKAEALAKAQVSEAEAAENDHKASPTKSMNRSTVKVEQLSATGDEIIRIWANAETAAATLQLPLDKIKQMLKDDYDEDIGDEIGGYRWRYAAAGAQVTGVGDSKTSKGSKKGKEAYLEFRDKLYDPAEPHSYKNGNRLRDYQVDGVNWLASTWYKRHSAILADEMGLGKTVQIVSYIEHLYRVEKIRRPYLVVVPLSTVEHWRREFQGWTDMVCCVYHDRQRIWRDVLREYEWYFEDRPHTPDYLKFDVLVTTYDTLIGDFDIIGQIPWRVAVVDEAHRLRNVKGKLLECMKEISARGTLQYGFQSRILITGTPLQNNTQELWTLLNFIEPAKFPSLERFEANFGNMANREQVEALQQAISPYMLRRVKEDVAKDIPAKEETVIDVELTSIQKQYYRAIFEHNHAFLSMGATRQNAPKLMNIQMELRKCCNHPFLLEGIEQRENERQFNEFLENGEFENKTAAEQQEMMNKRGYVDTSGKMVLLDKLLPKLRSEGHKVLIFSQMVRMLDLISEYCDFRGYKHERLDGRVRGNERQKSIDRFETDPDIGVFLLSTRAGGVGINLTAADTCIIFDSDWNPQNDVQAQARCHRIGQTKDVRVYRLITSRTFEQEMFDRASKKLGLEQAVLGTFNQEEDDDMPTNKEMEQLLKKGAYALIEDENDEIGKEFVADDIDNILAKRTRTRVVEGAKTASWLNKAGMVVTKSRFAGDKSASAQVDVDDPMFWQKVMPDFVTPTIMLTKLDELTELLEGKKKGPGRGRWRQKREEEKKRKEAEEKAQSEAAKPKQDEELKAESEATNGASKEARESDVEPMEISETKEASDAKSEAMEEIKENDDDEEEKSESEGYNLSRTNQRKVHKYMSDLKSMMDGIFVDAEDDSLPHSDKALCQKLLLTISVKDKIFNEEQRKFARNMLKRLEGDRRRRCRTSMEQPDRLSVESLRGQGNEEVREELLILSKHQRKRRRQRGRASTREPSAKRTKRDSIDGDGDSGGGYIGEDGYLHHSDSEADWSDVGEDPYQPGKKKSGISKKEANRRRAWATDDDAATAAGRPWPALPRPLVQQILSTLLDEVIKYDEEKGGLFSKPVSKEDLPEYYEEIENPMDYGTMREKLERGEYRSAQAMQKDFILVMQNCLKFNEKDSDIVREARQQALMRPGLLRQAAMKHKLFLAEDGTALEVNSDGEDDRDDKKSPKKKRKRKKRKGDDEGGDDESSLKVPRKKSSKSGQAKKSKGTEEESDDESDDEALASLKKPRIKISLKKEIKSKKRSGKSKKSIDDSEVGADGNEGDDDKTPATKRKRKSELSRKLSRKRSKKSSAPKDTPNVNENGNSDSDDGNSAAIYLDVNLWKTEREALDASFKAARAHFVKRGPWKLPSGVGGFRQAARQTLIKMGKHDIHDLFKKPVTDAEAEGYSEIVKNPMDFGTMKQKAETGGYGTGDVAAAGFYNDFLLTFDNCALYNDEDGDVGREAARLLRLLPETYSEACETAVAKQAKRVAERAEKKLKAEQT
jgi:chromodomain-helicase-DNA-binding protein 7